MTSIELGRSTEQVREHDVLSSAEAGGFTLVQFETDTGQLVWEWRRGSEPRPQFVSRRVALLWMADWLVRDRRVG